MLKPDSVNQILEAINKIQQELTLKNIEFVVLTSPKIRLAFRKLVSFNFPNMSILSLNEVPNEISIETVGTINV